MSNSTNILYYCTDFWRDFGDPRIKRLPLFGGPNPIVFTICAYLLLVFKIIPYFMSKRNPYSLRSSILCYNVSLVAINGFYFVYTLKSLNFGLSLLDLTIPSEKEMSPQIYNDLILSYFYFLTKIIDFMDTIFFALRKKTSQITFLHCYHHSLMVLLAWLAGWYRFNMLPNKLFILCNSFVHTLMYSYYALSAFGPKIQPYLWWKRYLTQLQLVQFIIFMCYGLINEVLGVPYPNSLKYFTQAQSPIFFYLFYEFYVNSYKKTQKKIN